MNRLQVAFHDMREALTVQELKAFVLLRQSSPTAEDKRKVITLSGGTLEAPKIENAMRALSTKILSAGSGEGKKRVYPANYVEDTSDEACNVAEEDLGEDLFVACCAEQGDEDAMFVSEYEDSVTEWTQDQPELASCFSAYTAARGRLRDKAKSRGFGRAGPKAVKKRARKDEALAARHWPKGSRHPPAVFAARKDIGNSNVLAEAGMETPHER